MSRLRQAVGSLLDLRVLLHVFRIAHFYGYSHVRPLREITRGPGLSIAPNVSFRNGARITIGARSHIGERSIVWAGNSTGRITLGEDVLIASGVVITASNYGIVRGVPPMYQDKVERDIVIGDGVWLGANVVVTAGVTIGAGAIIGAGAVVTRDVPPDSVAVGAPARVVSTRPEPEGTTE